MNRTDGAHPAGGRRTLRDLELRCPPLPQTLIEALDLIEDPSQMEVGPVTEMVQRDPIVVARLLHTVNSAYYGLRHTISSAERAVVMLGPVAVAGIVVGMHMLKLRSVLESPAGEAFNRLIRHSIATAYLSRYLLETSSREKKDDSSPVRIGISFTAGLLHDFGKIILVYNFAQEAVALYDKGAVEQKIEAPDDREMEQLLFGCDHTEAGEYAARKLNFPDALVDVIRLHHDPMRSSGIPETDRLVRVSAVANLAAKAMGHAFTREISWEEAMADPIWARALTADLPRFGSSDDLAEDLQSQQERLDQYLEHLVDNRSTNQALDRPKLYKTKDAWRRSAG